MKLSYKPTDDVAMRKHLAKKIGMCSIDLDVASMLARLHADVSLPGAEIYCPPVPDGPATLTIQFVHGGGA